MSLDNTSGLLSRIKFTMRKDFILSDIQHYLNRLLDMNNPTPEKITHKQFMADYMFRCYKADLTQTQLEYYLPSGIPLKVSSKIIFSNEVTNYLDGTRDKFFELYFFYKGLHTL